MSMTEFKNGDKVIVRLRDGQPRQALYVGVSPMHPQDHVVRFTDGGCDTYAEEFLLPCREPVKVEGWVNVYENGRTDGLYSDKKVADAWDRNNKKTTAWTRIACVYVSGTEGVEP